VRRSCSPASRPRRSRRDRALAQWGKAQTNKHLIPPTKFALAKALWDSKGDRARARRLAEEARLGYLANKGPWLPKANEVAQWQKTHR
jgi:eukaryotic-like serine/threonine-protein kinase